MKKLTGICILLLMTNAGFCEDIKDEILRSEQGLGWKDTYTNGVWADVMTYDKIYDTTPGFMNDRINSSVQKGLRTGKKPVIVIEENEKWNYEWELRHRGLEKDVELLIR
ncbi:MAG: hypothetical protein RBR42_01730 [Desulfomicrobium sp.]|nr:hypothetical protein [Desulfomicrobium sp.]NLV97881.1 hypothetical protein [Desulfovibrionales bacterium]